MYYNLIRKLSLVLTAWLFGVMPLVNEAIAQPAGWEDITPEGWTGDFLHIAKMSDGRLLTAASNGWLYESSDTAQSWHLLYKMPDKPQEGYAKFCMYEGEKGYLVTHKFVLYTDDSGHTWEVADMPELSNHEFTGAWQDRHYLAHYKSEDTIFFCTSTFRGVDVFRSTDGGKNWALAIYEMNNYVDHTISGFHWETPLHGFVYGSGHWCETFDGGKKWSKPTELGHWADQVHLVTSFSNGSALLCIQYWNGKECLTFISEDGSPNNQRDISYHENWIESGTFTGKYVIAGDEGIMRDGCKISADSGKTWATIPIDVAEEGYDKGAVSLGENTAVLCGSGLSTIRTTDGGKTWDVSIFGNGHDSKSMYCKNRNECFVLGQYGRLLKTDDGWKTWKAIDLIPQINAPDKFPCLVSMSFPTHDTNYVSGDDFIFRTIDGGDTWEKFEQSTSGIYLSFPTKDTGYVAYTNMTPYIERTTDAGLTWVSFGTLAGLKKKYSTELKFRNAREGLTSEIDKLMFTKDAGETWQTKDIDLGGNWLTTILATDDKWIIAGGNKVYSCDINFNCEMKHEFTGGKVLMQHLKKRGSVMYIYCDINSVLVSEDGGETWETRNDTLFKDVIFPDANIAYTSYFGGDFLYRRYYKSTIRMSVFEQYDSVTYTIGFIADAPGAGTLILRNKRGEELTSHTVQIQTSSEFSLALPKDIPAGDGYYYEFVPSDTLAFDRLQSPVFTVDTKHTGIGISPENLQYRLVGNALFCQCESASLYDMLGRQVHGHLEDGISLLPGVYMLRCGTQQHIFAVH